MDKKNIITILVIAGGGYLAYWYLTKQGPGGAVFDAAGNKIGVSWWEQWFGAALPGAGAATGTAAGAGAGAGTGAGAGAGRTIAPVPLRIQNGAPPVQQTLPPQQPSDTTVFTPTGARGNRGAAGGGAGYTDAALQSMRDALFAASGSSAALNADQWSYFLAQISGSALTPDQFGAAFPSITDTNRGPLMTVDQFIVALYQSQHGGASPVMSGLGDHVPVSMSFSRNRSAFPGRGGMYIQ